MISIIHIDMNEKLESLYNYVRSQPNLYKGVPDTYEAFAAALSDEKVGSSFHSALQRDANVRNLPDNYNAFVEWGGLKKKRTIKPLSEFISTDLSAASEGSSTTKSSSSSELSSQTGKPIDISYLLEDYQKSFSAPDISSRAAVQAIPKEVTPIQQQDTLSEYEDKPSVAENALSASLGVVGEIAKKVFPFKDGHVPNKQDYEFVKDLESVPDDKRAEHVAFMEGVEGYEEPVVLPQEDEEGNVVGYYYKTSVPDLTKASTAKDYFASSVVNNSVLGKSILYSLAAVDAASGIKEDARTAAQDYQNVINKNIEGYENPESWLGTAATVLGIVSDSPVFGMGGSIYKGTASGALKSVAYLEQKLLKSGITKQLAKKIAERTYLAASIEGAVGTSGALGLHGAIADLQSQYGDADYSYIEYSQSFRRLGYGSLTGAMVGFGMGFTGALANRVSDKYLLKALSSGSYNPATKTVANLQKYGVEAAGFPVEVGLFEVGNIIENGVDSFSVEGLKHNAITLAVLKGKAKLDQISKTPPVRKGEPLYDVDLSKREIESIGYKRKANAVDALRKDDAKLTSILNDAKVALDTKAKLLWTAKGVKITKLPTPSEIVLDGDYLRVLDGEGNFLHEVNTSELPNRNSFVSGMQRLVDHYDNIIKVKNATSEEYKAVDDALRSAKVEDGINNKGLVEALFKNPAEYSKEDIELLSKFNEVVKGSVIEKPKPVISEDVNLSEPRVVTKGEKNILKTSEVAEVRAIKEGDKEVGSVTVDKEGGYWRVKRVDVEPEQQQRGIAKETYRKLNAEANKEGSILLSDLPDKINDSSRRIWESLVKSNEAEKLEDGSYRMKKVSVEPKQDQPSTAESTISTETTKPTTQEQKPVTDVKTEQKRTIGGKDVGEVKKRGLGLEELSKSWRKLMKAEGLLPREWYDEWVKQQGAMAKLGKDLEFMFKDFKKALADTYGTKGLFKKPNVSKEEIEKLNTALANLGSGDTFRPEILETIPEGMHKVITTMRENIDALSRDMIRKGLVEGELEAVFDSNLGFYLNRSYRSFTDTSWQWDKIPLEIRNNAITWIKQEYAEGYERQLTDAEAISKLKGILDSEGGGFNVIKNGKIGSKDFSIFKRRMTIPEELRKLMGEYEDPMYNYAVSMLKMSDMLSKDIFLNNIIEKGIGKILFTEETGDYYSKITTEGNPSMRPLSDKPLYTKPEFSKAFNEFLKTSPDKGDTWSKLVKAWYITNGSIKYGKTILSPQTHVRNFTSNFGFHMANFRNPMQIIDSITDVALTYGGFKEGKKYTDEWREYIADLAARGVIGDNAKAGELIDVIRDVNKEFAKIDFGRKGMTRKALEFIQKLYQAEDDIHKIAAFEVEKKRYLDVYKKKHVDKPLEEIEEMAKTRAAEITRATMPTYSLVPDLIKAFRKAPIVGTFVSFPYEVFRTTWNTIDLARAELADESTSHLGIQRLTGLAMAAVTTASAATYSRHAFGVKRDDVKDLRRYLAPWNDNSDLFFIGEPKDGVYTFVDMGYSDPHNYIKKIMNAALLEWDNPAKAFEDAVYELSEPFLGEELTASTLMDIRSNKKSSNGQPIYNEADTDEAKNAKRIDYLFDNLKPGLLVSAERIYKATTGDERYRLGEEIAAVAGGFRITRVDVGKNFKYKVLSTRNMVTNAKDIYKDVLQEYNRSKKDFTPEQNEQWMDKLDKAHERSNKQLQKHLDELRLDYQAAINLGADPRLVRQTLSDMIRDDFAERYIRTGKYRNTRKLDGTW